ncbi:hypothetical protein [Nocardioides terrigena]|nr:hypothetical protein [Nocardioides terrigena]
MSAEAWDSLLTDIKDLGPNPDGALVMNLLIDKIWCTEGITLDEDHR